MRAFLKGENVTRERANSLFSTVCFPVGENLVRTRVLAYSTEWRREQAGGACCLLQAHDPLLPSKGYLQIESLKVLGFTTRANTVNPILTVELAGQ